jgi:hypothetical protein
VRKAQIEKLSSRSLQDSQHTKGMAAQTIKLKKMGI